MAAAMFVEPSSIQERPKTVCVNAHLLMPDDNA
jgi:hypothetical protein